MHQKKFRALFLLVVFGLLLVIVSSGQSSADDSADRDALDPAPALAPTPFFDYPVVPGSTISGHFDHSTSSGVVTFYDGRKNNPGAGFYFQCANPNMYDWVGCQDNVSGEQNCANDREVWYDGHKGTDYEYAANWHTGAYCNPGKFEGITKAVYAPAPGRVVYAGYNASQPGNGYHIRIEHDLNGNGNYADDGFRSIYLHFATNQLAVQYGDLVQKGQFLGLGGSTGYSSSPHLHFEIQRSNDNFTSRWSVDPYGWSGSGTDPWPYQNEVLFDLPAPVDYPPAVWLPNIQKGGSLCTGCGELIQNSGFEAGTGAWSWEGVQVITNSGLPIVPEWGIWVAWLGGRNNGVDALYQDFRVPDGLVSARFSYRLMVTTEETGGVYDVLRVRLTTTGGEVVQELETIDNDFTPRNQWVLRTVDLPVLVGRQGQTLRLRFDATTDSNLKTSFYLDEVSIEAKAP